MISSKNILIVEDSHTQAQKLIYLLESNGYEVQWVENGIKAMFAVKLQPFDLIISDIVMPEMDGFELCKTLKGDDRYKSIPIILLTSLNNINDVIKGLSVGADNYSSKPFNNEMLLARIEQILGDTLFSEKLDESGCFDVCIENEHFQIISDPAKILGYFISTYEASVQMNRDLEQTKNQLQELNNNLEKIVNHRTFELQGEIASHKKTLNELQAALVKAQKIDLLKSEFLQNLSHEVRTPMNTIIGFSDVIKDGDSSVELIRQFLPHICNSVEKLLEIIHNMLEAAEISSGNVVLRKSEINYSSFIEKLKIKYLATQKKDLKFEVAMDKELCNKGMKTYSDKIMLVLDKLIANAFKFTKKGSVKVNISMVDKQFIQISVADTGIGIPADKHDEIFESFKQISQPTNLKYNGTGVGLFTSRSMVELMGGKIWLESKLGEGSTFYFTVPYSIDSENNISHETNEKTNSNVRYSVLIAEDNEVNYQLIKTMASKTNIDLHWVKNGKEAFEYYAQHSNSIHMVLMDMMLKMNGIAAAKMIKEKYPDALVFALTAYPEEIENKNYRQMGFNGIIKKPIQPSKLIQIIQKEQMDISQKQ